MDMVCQSCGASLTAPFGISRLFGGRERRFYICVCAWITEILFAAGSFEKYSFCHKLITLDDIELHQEDLPIDNSFEKW